MATAIKTSLEKVLQAYTVGDQKFSLSPIHKSAVGLGSYLPEQERHLLRPYEELIKQGLVAARRGDLAAARQLFDSSQSLLSSVPFSDEGLLLCKSTYNAATSYLDYCRKDFTTALERLDEALAIDEQLERRKKEYEPLQLHRVQLLLNSIQVHIKRNHPQEALSMSFHILNYLEGKTKTIPAPSSWDSATLKPLPQEVITDLFVGVSYKIASLVAGQKTLLIEDRTLDVRDLFADARLHIQMDSADSCYLSPQAHSWLRAKQAWLDDDGDSFLAQAGAILAEGRGDAPFLWYATVIDLFAFCQQLGLPEATRVKDSIEQVPEHIWRNLPGTWKQVLGSKRSTL